MGYSTLHSVYIVTVLIATSGVLVSAQAESCDTECTRCTDSYDCCFHVNEEQEEPMFVGSATVHPEYEPSSNFTFRLDEGTYRENFTVSDTGDITTTQLNIDVDNSEIRCIRILIQVNNVVSLWTFAVEIDDINDNAPEFQADDITITVDEGPAGEVSVCGINLQATDKDLEVSTNANITYSITGGDDSAYFTMSDTTRPCIRNVLELDRDTASSDPYTLSFTLEARDAGVAEVHTTTTTITIVVQDINDNAPRFADSSPDLTVPENTLVNDTIVSFEATDPDAGTNSELRYEIVSPPEGLPFAIDSVTGGLRLIEQLDWEPTSGREFAFTIRATDMGVSPMFGTADVMVFVSDVNEKIDIDFGVPEGNMVTVSEDDTISVVLSFEVVDDDDSDNKDNTIRFLSGGEYFSSRNLFDRFQVYQNVSIDREDMEMLILSIEFVQGGRPVFSDIINITVNVLDVNDNYPELNQTFFEVVENENDFHKITELGLSARDRDKDENGTIVSYELISVTNDMKFKDLTEAFLQTNDNIQANGLLLAPMLDREEDGPFLNVTMNLTDGGGNSALLSFTVEILDINDQVPVFTQTSYEFHIPEGESNLVAGEVTARDDDKGLNGTVTYRLEQPSDDFWINSTTGEIATSPNKTFDREETPRFILHVTASDNGIPSNPANSSVEVVIVIDDENDNLPEFDENQKTSFTVQSDADVGTRIGQVIATDKDVGSNAEVRYKIEPSNHFSINLTTGHISVTQPLTTDEVFNLTVTAYNVVDPGDRSTSLDITVTVTPAPSSSEISIVVVTSGAISGVMAVVVLLTLLLVIWCCCYQKKRRGGITFSRSPSSSLNNGEARKGIMRPPVNSITGGTLRVTFKEEVVKRVYDVGQSVNSDTLDTESAINLDSSDESQTPPRIRQNGNIHTSEGLLNGVPGHTNMYTQQPRQRAPFVRMIQDVPNPELELSEGSITDEQNNFDGNSDEESNFSSDDASNVNVSLPIFEEHHMRYPPPLHHHPPPYKQPYSPPHVSSPLAVSSLLPHAHMHVDVHNSGSLTLTPPDSHHSNSLSSHTPTPPYHQILASLTSPSHHPMHTLSSSRNYPAVMPDAFGTPVIPLPTHYTPSFDYDYTSTYASSDLDEELKFNDTEPGFCSLTATDVYSDEESDSQL